MIESRGCPSFKASKGEAVVGYRNPLATQKMERHRLFRRANKMGFKNGQLHLTYRGINNFDHIMNNQRIIKNIKNYPILFTIL